MGIICAAIASFFCALGNLCMRRSIDHGGTTKAYLVIQFLSAIFLMILLNPVRTGQYTFNIPISLLALLAGITLALMLFSLGKALEKGPPGLTFAFISSSSVVPAIIMATLFGTTFGHQYTLYHGLGSLLVLFGLFWAGREVSKSKALRTWVIAICLAFLLHVVFLVIMQWRVLLITAPNISVFYKLMSATEANSQWFMPMIYMGAFLSQLLVFLLSEKRAPNSYETGYGVIGGLCNGGSTFFLIQATELASPLENAMIFPVFSVLIIVVCNIWGKRLYDEKVNWKATQLCITGLVIGTVDWSIVGKAFGF